MLFRSISQDSSKMIESLMIEYPHLPYIFIPTEVQDIRDKYTKLRSELEPFTDEDNADELPEKFSKKDENGHRIPLIDEERSKHIIEVCHDLVVNEAAKIAETMRETVLQALAPSPVSTVGGGGNKEGGGAKEEGLLAQAEATAAAQPVPSSVVDVSSVEHNGSVGESQSQGRNGGGGGGAGK